LVTVELPTYRFPRAHTPPPTCATARLRVIVECMIVTVASPEIAPPRSTPEARVTSPDGIPVRFRFCLVARATIVERGPITRACAVDVFGDRRQKRRAAALEACRR
jgi:hypothetical protein